MSLPASKRAPALVLAVLFLDMLCQGLSYPAMPSLLAELTGSGPQAAARLYGWMLASYAGCELIGGPILGQLSDRFGRKPILLFSTLSASLCYLISATAPSYSFVLGGYALAGFTSAMMVVVNAAIADSTEPEERPKWFGYMGATFGLGFVIGPAVGGMVASLGLRVPFFASSALMLLGGIAVAVALPETLARENRSQTTSWKSVLPWRALGAVWSKPVLRGLATVVALNALAIQMLIAVWIPYSTYRYGLDPAGNGFLLATFGLAQAVSQALIVPWLLGKLGIKRGLMIGLVVSILSFVGYGLAGNIWLMVGVLVIGTLGAMDEPAIQTLITGESGSDEQGAVQGGMGMLGSTMGIIGPVLGTTIFGIWSGPKAAMDIPGMTYFASAGCVLVGLLVAWRVVGKMNPTVDSTAA